jgi:hypothetical protein
MTLFLVIAAGSVGVAARYGLSVIGGLAAAACGYYGTRWLTS